MLAEIRKAIVAAFLAGIGAYQAAQPHTADAWATVIGAAIVAGAGT